MRDSVRARALQEGLTYAPPPRIAFSTRRWKAPNSFAKLSVLRPVPRTLPPSTTQSSLHTSAKKLRLWLTITAAPWNAFRAAAKASKVSMSKWLVGSSSSKRCGRCQTAAANASRAFWPPDSVPTFCFAMPPRPKFAK
mmetsp:Transcript_41432/g.125180  ORF Transcript_41432/g.125180 Transcript_41432/m.125180 type:complete len:138 (+) Transcript_41432:262-675(+)